VGACSDSIIKGLNEALKLEGGGDAFDGIVSACRRRTPSWSMIKCVLNAVLTFDDIKIAICDSCGWAVLLCTVGDELVRRVVEEQRAERGQHYEYHQPPKAAISEWKPPLIRYHERLSSFSTPFSYLIATGSTRTRSVSIIDLRGYSLCLRVPRLESQFQ
jgi:hypothetical protein